MATIMPREQRDGTVRYTALVRVKGFKPVAKTFASEKLANHWGEQRERELTAERASRTAAPDLSTFTIEDLHIKYLKDPDVKSLASFSDVRRVLASFAREFRQVQVMDLSPLQIRNWRDRLAVDHVPAGVNRKMAVVRSAWNWGIAAGYVPKSQTWPTRIMLKVTKGRERFLDDAELGRLLDAAESDPVMHTLLTVAASTGMRRGELLRLEWQHIDFQRCVATIFKTKTDKPRNVYLAPAAIDALKRLGGDKVTDLRGSVWITEQGIALSETSLGKRFRKIRKAAKLDDFRLHDVRHSCASWLAQSGASLYQIGSVLGHTSVATTARYSHLIAGAEMPGHAAISARLAAKARRAP